MKQLLQFFLIFILFLMVGCGSGGSSNSDEPVIIEEYKNSTLPEISEKVIPDVLLDKSNKLSKKEKSNGFLNLRERVNYFYFRQINMNMELSYIDSVWNQIDTYCKGKKICDIPKDKISFTYTQSLYNHDIALIERYEKKSLNILLFKDAKKDLKDKIGEESFLGASRLTRLSNSNFDYKLQANISNITLNDDNLTTIINWNKRETLYSMREELYNGENGDRGICIDRTGSVIYTGFDYNKSLESIDNSFSYGYKADCFSPDNVNSKYIQKYDTLLNLLELPTKIKLTEDSSYKIISQEYNTPLNSHLEGEVTESGGYVISSDTEGFYIHEKFDIEGNIIDSINCIGDEDDDLDSCIIRGKEAIKSIIVKNVYKVGVFEKAPVNILATHSAVFFNEDNSLNAFINCSTFKADYLLDNKGITFSNIIEEQNSSLVCLDRSFEENFKSFLEKGYKFNDEGYIVWNGLSAELDTIGKKSEFDKKAFINKVTANRYVDSITMSNLFKVTGWDGLFSNPTENRNYSLSSSPSMYIKNQKIYIDLIDATFNADIVVIDNDTIQFTNIVKVAKDNLNYPSNGCGNKPEREECSEMKYEDKSFTDIIEKFLNGDVLVSNSGVPDNGILWFHNDILSFSVLY